MPVLLAGAVALGLSALPPTAQAPFAATILAQTAARLAICPAPADLILNNVRVESLQQAGDGFGVFYSATCLGDGITAPPAGFLVFQREGYSWQNLGGEDISYYDAGCMTPRVAGQKLCCMVSNGDDSRYTAVFGLVLASNVKQIEIAFADGAVLRSGIVEHRFAIARPAVAQAGELRALASDGRVLDAFPLDLSAGAQMRGITGCRA
jgi:hypothetical protein